jgi:hypothetical protein
VQTDVAQVDAAAIEGQVFAAQRASLEQADPIRLVLSAQPEGAAKRCTTLCACARGHAHVWNQWTNAELCSSGTRPSESCGARRLLNELDGKMTLHVTITWVFGQPCHLQTVLAIRSPDRALARTCRSLSKHSCEDS